MFSEILNLVISSPWTVLFSVLLLLLSYDFYRRRGLPPGPYGLPFIGYLPFMDQHRLAPQSVELCKKYQTELLCVTVPFAPPLIFINNFELVKECFQKRVDLMDKKDPSLFRIFGDDYSGILGSNGEKWKQVRKFSVSVLREFGMGRAGAEQRVQNESNILITAIKKYDGKPLDPAKLINVSVANIVCGLVFGERFDIQNEKFNTALNGINNLLGMVSNTALNVAANVKFLKYTFLKNTYQRALSNYLDFNVFVREKIAEHHQNYNGEVTDFIYAFMKEMLENEPEYFDEKMLESIILDLFAAGSETSSTTLRWALLAMAAHPDIQSKVHQELDTVLQDNKIVNMNHKKSTPYTDAVICEIQRHFTLLPLGGSHGNVKEDVFVRGYRIPKKALVFALLNEFHHDPKHWKNPDNFDPENFLEEGEVAHLDRLVPFGIGRRSCAGESLAKMELYLFFAALMKEFKVEPETDDTVPDLHGTGGGFYAPKPFKVRMIPRSGKTFEK